MFELYNKDIKVAEITESDYRLKIVEADLLPFELRCSKSASYFLNNRFHNANKKYSALIEELLGVDSVEKMIDRTALASLNDTFWLKKEDSDLSWNDVNLYDEKNRFDMSLFKTALSGLTEDEYVSYLQKESLSHIVTPELTTGGSYAKAWYRDPENGLCLLKHGRKQYSNREVVSEYLSANLAKQLCKNAAEYRLKRYGGNLYCASKIFTDENNSFISFSDYMYATDIYQKSTESTIDYVKRIVSDFDDESKIDEMLISDVLILNKDRHYGNFGFLYDPDTMNIKSFSPIFDFNQSLCFDVPDYLIERMNDYKPDIFFKTGGLMSDIVKSCCTEDLICKVEDCELDIPDDINFEFWDEKRSELVKRLFDYQKEKVLKSSRYYALSNTFDPESDNQDCNNDLEI